MGVTYGTLHIAGASGRIWNVEMYIPDTVASQIGFSLVSKGAAANTTQMIVPESGMIVGITLTTAPTAVGCTIQLDNQLVVGGTIRYEVNVTGGVSKAPIAIPVRAGQRLSMVQW